MGLNPYDCVPYKKWKFRPRDDCVKTQGEAAICKRREASKETNPADT